MHLNCYSSSMHLPSFKSYYFSGSLKLGPLGQPTKIKTTPLLQNPHRPSLYYVNLTAVSVGRVTVPIQAQHLGFDPVIGSRTIIDSGTVTTRFVRPTYEAIRDEFRAQVKGPFSQIGTFDTCFPVTHEQVAPIVTLRFAELDLKLPMENTLRERDFCSLEKVTELMEKVEHLFIKNFFDANRREGMKPLRPTPKREKHKVTFLSGFFSGCTVALVIAIILMVRARSIMEKGEGSLYMDNMFGLYSLFLYIVLHMLMYATDIYFWKRYRINYLFIFNFKLGNELGFRDVFLLSTGLAVVGLASFLASSEARRFNSKVVKCFS